MIGINNITYKYEIFIFILLFILYIKLEKNKS